MFIEIDLPLGFVPGGHYLSSYALAYAINRAAFIVAIHLAQKTKAVRACMMAAE